MPKRFGRIFIRLVVIFLFLIVSRPLPRYAVSTCNSMAVQQYLGADVVRLSQLLNKAQGQEQIVLKIRRGEAYQTSGHLDAALEDYHSALDEASAANEPLLAAVAAQNLGYVHFLRQEPEQAEPLLRSALKQAEKIDKPSLAAASANRLAVVLSSQGRQEEAYPFFRKALEYASQTDDFALTAAIHRNLARVLADTDRAMAQLVVARKAATRVTSPTERIDLLLGIGVEAKRERFDVAGIALAYDVLMKALDLSSDLDDARRLSQAAGHLGAIYERRGRQDDAYGLTVQALEAAQRLQAHDLLLFWEWQIGRLLRSQGDRKEAIAAYRRVVFHIEAIRQDIPVIYQDGRSSFKATLTPIYMGLADMLLLQAEVEKGEIRQDMLQEAQSVVERFKRSELTDYFRDPCIAALRQRVENLSPGTMVIYPIILSERLELLINIGDRLERRTVPVSRERLERTVSSLVHRLRNEKAFKDLSQEVYAWLIQPLEGILEKHHTDTLVYVPGGVLRLLPIGALWDGERFVTERYATVTLPGLTLLNPAPLARGGMVTLMAGMSELGPVVFNLPEPLLQALCNLDSNQINHGVRGLSVETVQLSGMKGVKGPKGMPPEKVERIQRLLSLPGVEGEISQLSKQLPGKVMLNEKFLLERFISELADNPSYRVVHIASHGYFGGTPEQNFIMTYDQCLDMDKLSALIKPKQLAAKPVELVTFSACQTAEGDDRSPLGLSGVVLKSGARSALGSLWPVSDSAAQALLPRFYSYLKEKGMTKAEALRHAQMSLMAEDGFKHPFYWAPFILVGNWL
ncbi:MAG: CHAT domain-containing protein [Desulfobacterales bacterium]|nr:CHAT domain-containing protein [Desulfobacterales bacterium]